MRIEKRMACKLFRWWKKYHSQVNPAAKWKMGSELPKILGTTGKKPPKKKKQK